MTTPTSTGTASAADPAGSGGASLDLARAVRRLSTWLLAGVALLGLANGVTLLLRYGPWSERGWESLTLFDLTEEASIGTWFSVVLLCLAAGAAAVAGLVDRRRASGRWARNWWLLGAVLVLMSIDEVAMLHERTMYYLPQGSGLLRLTWVVPALVLAAVFALVQVRWLRSLPRVTRRRLVAAGILFVVAAAGLEMVEAVVSEDGTRSGDVALHVLGWIEEVCEMLAVIAVLYVTGTHVASVLGRGTLTWAGRSAQRS